MGCTLSHLNRGKVGLWGTEKIILEFNNVLEEEGERKTLALVIWNAYLEMKHALVNFLNNFV